MTTGNSKPKLAWLLAWLVFGALAAYEIGALAMRTSRNEWLVLLYLACSIGALSVLLVHTVRSALPGRMAALVVLAILALAASLWAIYGVGHGDWIAAAMFGAFYSAACLLAGIVAMLVAARRKRVAEVVAEGKQADLARHRRLERIRAQSFVQDPAGKPGAGPDEEYGLPKRPKWEDS